MMHVGFLSGSLYLILPYSLCVCLGRQWCGQAVGCWEWPDHWGRGSRHRVCWGRQPVVRKGIPGVLGRREQPVLLVQEVQRCSLPKTSQRIMNLLYANSNGLEQTKKIVGVFSKYNDSERGSVYTKRNIKGRRADFKERTKSF